MCSNSLKDSLTWCLCNSLLSSTNNFSAPTFFSVWMTKLPTKQGWRLVMCIANKQVKLVMVVSSVNVIRSILVYFSTFTCVKFIYGSLLIQYFRVKWSFFQLLYFVVVVVCHCSIPLHSWNYIEFASKIEKEMICACGLKLRLHVDRVSLLIRTNCIVVFASIEDRNHFIANHFLYITRG